jgi:hypothetical protein
VKSNPYFGMGGWERVIIFENFDIPYKKQISKPMLLSLLLLSTSMVVVDVVCLFVFDRDDHESDDIC